MTEFTDETRTTIDDLARRHGVSTSTAEALAHALAASGGAMAQFNIPELGGMGQWSSGMLMIGDMFNSGLKARVAALIEELAGLARGGAFAPAMLQRGAVPESVSLFNAGGGRGPAAWWPGELGAPAAAGSQNDMHYASFPQARRLAIRVGGRTTVYDSGDHLISGVAQQQGSDQSVTFTSQRGLVRIADLRVVA